MISINLSGRLPLGYSQVTSLSSAAGVGTIPDGTNLAVIQCESQQVRWRDDGTNPTTSVGMLMSVGDVMSYDAAKFASLKFIEVTASAKLNIAYYA